jgi:acyl-CoA thioester hydrolase
MTNPQLRHRKIFAIAWGDMDALGHVNNARYFDYFQEARIEWLASIKIPMTQGEGPVLIHTACTYLKPVIYPATLILESKFHSLGTTSMIMGHEIYQDSVLMAQGSSKVVWVNYTTGRPIPIPDTIRNLFD